MKKLLGLLLLVTTYSIAGCSGESEMKEQIEALKNHETYAGVFSENTENRKVFGFNIDGGNQLHFTYYEKISGDWFNVSYTTSWEKEIDWDLISKGNGPYVYVGTILDETILKVVVGNKEAKINDVEGKKRFWYYVDKKRKDLEIKILREDGSQLIVKEKWY
jgi:hypothetical protein